MNLMGCDQVAKVRKSEPCFVRSAFEELSELALQSVSQRCDSKPSAGRFLLGATARLT